MEYQVVVPEATRGQLKTTHCHDPSVLVRGCPLAVMQVNYNRKTGRNT